MTRPQPPEFVHTQADMEAYWRALVNPLGWPERRIWFTYFDAVGRPLHLMQEITEVEPTLDAELADRLVWMGSKVLAEHAPGGSIGVMLARPGRGGPTHVDRSQADVLMAASAAQDVSMEVIHLATDEDFWPIPADVL